MTREDREPETGLRLIIGYKVVKATAAVILGTGLLAANGSDLAGHVHALASNLLQHATSAWSIRLSTWLLDAVTARNLHVVALACLLDAALTGVEAWALHRRFWWSGWLVVLATSALLPFEGIALVRHFAWGRVLVTVGSVLIVAYLVRFQLRGGAGLSARSRSP